MKFPKLSLVKHGQTIKVECYVRNSNKPRDLLFSSEDGLGWTNSKGIGFNIDYLKKPKYFVRIPQKFVHEFLHFYFPTFEISKLIHKIERETKGLVL